MNLEHFSEVSRKFKLFFRRFFIYINSEVIYINSKISEIFHSVISKENL